jgi:hypothetical protein
MRGNILKITPDPNPFGTEIPSTLARRLNRLIAEGYEISPHDDCSLVVLKYPHRIKGITSPIMLLGNGDLATFEGWPYELDRIFVPAGDRHKFDRFIAGVLLTNRSWSVRMTQWLKLLGEFAVTVAMVVVLYFAADLVVAWLYE